MFIKQEIGRKLIAVSEVYGTKAPDGWSEITREEYNRLLSEIRTKAAHVEAVYADPAKIDAVPAEWRDEILRRVEERRAQQPKPTDEVDAEELGAMLMEVL